MIDMMLMVVVGGVITVALVVYTLAIVGWVRSKRFEK